MYETEGIGFFEALGRILLGICIVIGCLIILDLIIYIGFMNSDVSASINTAYQKSYNQGYTRNYDDAYQLTYGDAFDEGYEKGYQIGTDTQQETDITPRVELHNPTYQELREFIARDLTDSNPYIKGVYMCADFAADVNNNAEFQGIRAAYVIIHAREWNHAIVAFETVDRGIIFVEPILDTGVEVVVGQPYRWMEGREDSTPYEDTVVELEFIW